MAYSTHARAGCCVSCYKPIEAGKLAAIPEARFCVACAKRNEKYESRKTQAELNLQEIKDRPKDDCSSPDCSAGQNGWVSGKKKKYRAPILRETVYDDGRPSESVVIFQKKPKHKHTKALQPTTAAKVALDSVFRYKTGEAPLDGDVVYTDDTSKVEHKHMWIVVHVVMNIIECLQEGNDSRANHFYIRDMKMLLRKDEYEAAKESEVESVT